MHFRKLRNFFSLNQSASISLIAGSNKNHLSFHFYCDVEALNNGTVFSTYCMKHHVHFSFCQYPMCKERHQAPCSWPDGKNAYLAIFLLFGLPVLFCVLFLLLLICSWMCSLVPLLCHKIAFILRNSKLCVHVVEVWHCFLSVGFPAPAVISII